MRIEMREIAGKRGVRALPVIFALAALLMAGCAAKTPPGKMEFHPSPGLSEKSVSGKESNDDTSAIQGSYSRDGEELRFENSDITVLLKEARKDDVEREGDRLFERLVALDFVLLQMSITNRSETKKVRYEPAITALMDSNLGYSKPLDYPGLYELAVKDTELGKGLLLFRGSFYDLGVTVMPLQSISRYIIFRPVSKSAKRARLVINNLYVGTEVIDLLFPFVITEACGCEE